MHVDGFRFDLASILSRDQEGRAMASPPILWDIESDPILANIKLIAEAWDADICDRVHLARLPCLRLCAASPAQPSYLACREAGRLSASVSEHMV
jgi:hypothetical protein